MHPDCDESLQDIVINVMPKEPDKWKFAFENELHLLLWFKLTELERLSLQGFNVYKITIDDKYIISGSRQVIYHSGNEISITELKPEIIKTMFNENEHLILRMMNKIISM